MFLKYWLNISKQYLIFLISSTSSQGNELFWNNKPSLKDTPYFEIVIRYQDILSHCFNIVSCFQKISQDFKILSQYV